MNLSNTPIYQAQSQILGFKDKNIAESYSRLRDQVWKLTVIIDFNAWYGKNLQEKQWEGLGPSGRVLDIPYQLDGKGKQKFAWEPVG